MEKILVVDDNKLVRWSVGKALTRDKYEVELAGTGEEGLEKATGASFDLVITDLKMPGMDGIELLSGLRKLSVAPQVIIITAYGTVQAKQKAMSAGAYGFIDKPFKIDELKAVVKHALS